MGDASGVADLGGIEARLAALPRRVNGDAVLLRRGRYLNTICELDIGGDSMLLRLSDGRIADGPRNPSGMPSADFASIRAATLIPPPPAPDPPPSLRSLNAGCGEQ